MPDPNGLPDTCSPCEKEMSSDDPVTGDRPVKMTLERIIELTGELEHLNELILVHLEKCGGFSSTQAYFAIVQPILDQLEIELRFRYRSGMALQQITLIVQDWIDKELAEQKKK